MNFKSISLITIAITIIAINLAIFIAPNSYAADVKCNILPDSICQKATQSSTGQQTSSNNAILAFLQWVIRILTAGIGVVSVGIFVYAGILYSSSNGNPDLVKKSKDMMTNTVIGLVIFAIMALALQWLIPGGVF